MRGACPPEQVHSLRLALQETFVGNGVADVLWMLAGSAPDERALRYMTPTSLIAGLYTSFGPDTQSCFRQAVREEVEEWDSEKGLQMLRELSFLVADTNTEQAVPSLVHHVDGFSDSLDDDDTRQGVANVVGVIAKFKRSEDAVQAQERWFGDPRFELLGAMLFNGLTGANPDAYPKYVPRFLEIVKKNPDHFVMEAVMMQFVHGVTPEVVIKHAHELHPDDATEFIRLLSTLQTEENKEEA